MTLTHEELRRRLDYNPDTGEFTHLVSGGGKAAGTRAGILSVGRWYVNVNGRRYLAHRAAWFWVHGEWPVAEIDHANGDPSDNRIDNLRPATRAQNNANRGGNKKTRLGLKGAYFDTRDNTYYSTIKMPNGKQKRLGTFKTAEEAHNAFMAKARELYGEWAR